MASPRRVQLGCTSSALPGDVKAQDWSEIEEEDDNMLVKLQRALLRQAFLEDLQGQTSNIVGIVSHHLSLNRSQRCDVSDKSEWLYGSFNVCIPITITKWRKQRLILRCPFPYMVGGPDGLDEKVRCEAATFVWISQNCPRVPIPRLWGFGLPDGTSFTPVTYLPWYRRIIESLKRGWAWRQAYNAPFSPRPTRFSLKSGYLLVDLIEKEKGVMLSQMWPPKTNEQRRALYRSLSKIMVDLARHHHPKIGAFTIDNLGNMSLSNRPLTVLLPLLESDGIPISIPRAQTYITTDSYIYDLLNCHDLKLQHQRNAVRDKWDAEGQMAVLTTMRTLSPNFTMDHFRRGPFCHIWTDCHDSNIFVNQEYEITCLPDLERISVLPLEELSPPFWLSGYAVDELEGDNEKHYKHMCEEFLEIFEEEDDGKLSTTAIMRNALEKGTHWFWASLNHPRATYNIFFDHLQPRLAPTQLEGEECIQFQRILAQYWTPNAPAFIDQKLCERESYLKDLRALWQPRLC